MGGEKPDFEAIRRRAASAQDDMRDEISRELNRNRDEGKEQGREKEKAEPDKVLDRKIEEKEKEVQQADEKVKGLKAKKAELEGKLGLPKSKEKPETAPAKKDEKQEKAPEPKEKIKTLAERVTEERNKIIPRDERGNPSNEPRHSFDPSQIPNGTVQMLGKIIDTNTPRGKETVAKYNVYQAARSAEIRARVLEDKGKLPDEITPNSERAYAELGAQTSMQIDNWKPSPDIYEKYLIKNKNGQ